MNITKITKKNGNKYELIIDNKKHIICDDVLLKYHILKPCEISKETFEKLIKSNDETLVYTKIINYISFKMRSEREVRDKLYTLTTSGNLIEDILARLRSEGYLNNNKYLDSFISDRLSLTIYGPNRIKSDLIKKGFSEKEIDKSLDLIDSKAWEDKCNKIVAKMAKSLRNGSNRANIAKIRHNLINNGYEDKYFTKILGNLKLNEENNLKKEYEIIKKKLSSKYSGDTLEYKIKEKLYAKGYDISKI